jgi:nitrate/nitrite transporter NarK
LINTVGNLAGFAAPYITGAVKDYTGLYQPPMMIVGAFMLLSAILTFVVGLKVRRNQTTSKAYASLNP